MYIQLGRELSSGDVMLVLFSAIIGLSSASDAAMPLQARRVEERNSLRMTK